MAKRPDGCLVETDPLAAMLRRFLDEWNLTRPQTAGRFADGGSTTEVSPMRPAAWLSFASSVSEATIQHIVERRYRMTELRIADALLTALEQTDVLCDWTIYPNPSARAEDRAECCGGSSMPPTLAPAFAR